MIVAANEILRFITQFTTYSSTHVPHMYHCHILEHEDGGMMGQFLIADMEWNLSEIGPLTSPHAPDH